MSRITRLISTGIIGGGAAAPVTVAITSAESSVTNLSPFGVTITFSEQVDDFVVGDITVGNGSADNFATADNIVFTADITPSGAGAVTVDVAAGVCTSTATGASNSAATQFSIVYDPYTVALLHLNADMTDERGKTWTANNSANIDTGNKKFGAGSLVVTRGTSQKNISTGDHADWNFGSGAFTLDLWFRVNSLGAAGYYFLLGQYVDAQNLWALKMYHASGSALTQANFTVKVANVDIIDRWFTLPATISADGNFHHAELGRSGNNFYFFLDGAASASNPQADTDAMPDLAGSMYVGWPVNTSGLDGWVDEVRISKGVCRHTTAFTPETTEYP